VRGIANGRVIDRAVAANRLPDRFLQQQCDHFAANAYHPSGIFGGVFLQAPTTSNSTNRELPRHVLKTCRNRFAGAFYVFHVSGSAGAETARAPARVGPLGDSHCDIVQSYWSQLRVCFSRPARGRSDTWAAYSSFAGQYSAGTRGGLRKHGLTTRQRARDWHRHILQFPKCAVRRARSPLYDACDVPISRVCCSRGARQLLGQHYRCLPYSRCLHRTDSQRRKARRPTSSAGQKNRTILQS
jgi:hypothetical protein